MSDDNPAAVNNADENLPKKRGPGRPRKSELEKIAKPGKPGRPKGNAAIIKEYVNRMVASPKSERVLAKIFDAALDDEHKHQAAAWKLVLDRVAPVSVVEQEILQTGGRPQINIKIEALKDVNIHTPSSDSDVIDGDVVDGELVDE